MVDGDHGDHGDDGERAKRDLHRSLRQGREALLWKLEGLGEYDARRPLTPTGTNLLGLVKHLAAVEAGYFGYAFERPLPDAPTWMVDHEADPTADLWATATESRADVVGLYRRVWEHADETIRTRALASTGRVPWWPDDEAVVTLHRVLVHVATETHRHAGHADIVRELIDGTIGLHASAENLPDADTRWWAAHHARVEAAARAAGEAATRAAGGA